MAILCVAMSSVIQSCAVMTSSSDCASKADCPDDDANGPTSSSSGGSEAGGDDGGDATAADVSSEAAPPLDAPADGTLADVVSEDSTVGDVVSEPAVDAPRDVAPDVASDAPGPTGDGCIATVESCTNGIDDTCDGKIDCADPACSGFTCIPQVPAGWMGPALLWLGPSTATAPACPGAYQTPIDGHEGPTGSPDTCGACTCAPVGQVCAGTGSFHVDQHCTSAGCITGAVSSASTACTNLASNQCGNSGSFEIGGGLVPTPTGGACTPQTTATSGSPEGWTTSARICAWAGSNDTPGGCNPATDQCVGASPGTAGGFAATVCVFQSGDVACPAAYRNNRNVVFSGESDTRTCGCTCTTGLPIGGSCSGTVSLFGAADCAGTAVPYTLGTMCLQYTGIGPIAPASVQAAITLTPGTCAVATQATAIGGVVGSGPTTVCCM